MTIRTAEEIFHHKMADQYDMEYWNDLKENNPNMYSVLLNSMQEYARQFIDLAAEEAKIKRINGCYDSVDRESIFKIKDLIK
jgi:hypothetical protein